MPPPQRPKLELNNIWQFRWLNEKKTVTLHSQFNQKEQYEAHEKDNVGVADACPRRGHACSDAIVERDAQSEEKGNHLWHCPSVWHH
jgi:hypothetical protein